MTDKCRACGLASPRECPINYPRYCALVDTKPEQSDASPRAGRTYKLPSRQLTSNLLFWISFIDKGFSFDEVAKLQLRNDLLASADLAVNEATREALDELARINENKLDQRDCGLGLAVQERRKVPKHDGSDAERARVQREDRELLRRAGERVAECQEGASGERVFTREPKRGIAQGPLDYLPGDARRPTPKE